MVVTGLDKIRESAHPALTGNRAAVLCHAASVANDYTHILDIFYESSHLELGAIFGPQHGLFGQTQDNMIEWESGEPHPRYGVTVYSLYGKHRKPTPAMLKGIEVFVADLQDVGARPYTYIWSIKHCMEACSELGIPVVILDRPNPIADITFDGGLLDPAFFTFVGGAEIPLCHRMTMGEMVLFIRDDYFPNLDLTVITMDGWNRSMEFRKTGLPWVLPSPNMPTPDTAAVYPGQVLVEALTMSEARGTTLPFELFGAPGIDAPVLIAELEKLNVPGVFFRHHDFIPSFQKHAKSYCGGVQIHVTDRAAFLPVYTTAAIIRALLTCGFADATLFKNPPYEYEETLLPFDILSGNTFLREYLLSDKPLDKLPAIWQDERKPFMEKFKNIALYGEDA